MRTSLAQELGLQETVSENLSHSLFGGDKKTSQTHKVHTFQVSDLVNSYTTKEEQERLCGN